MSVRRLAEKQPASFAFTPENEAFCQKEISKYPPGRQASAIIPLLWFTTRRRYLGAYAFGTSTSVVLWGVAILLTAISLWSVWEAL